MMRTWHERLRSCVNRFNRLQHRRHAREERTFLKIAD